MAEACPSASSRKRKRRAKKARAEKHLSDISAKTWEKKLAADSGHEQPIAEDSPDKEPTSLQEIFA